MKNRSLDIGLRLIVGAVLLTAAISKLPMQEEWVENVIAYRILPVHLAKLYALALPWLELTTGLCLIIGFGTKFFCSLAILLVTSFIVANVNMLSIDHSGACHCFYGFIKFTTLNYKLALLIDVALLIGVILILFQRKHYMALDSQVAYFLPKLKLKQ